MATTIFISNRSCFDSLFLRQSPRHQLRNVQQLRRIFAACCECILKHRIAEGAGCGNDIGASRGEFRRAHLAHAVALFLTQKREASAGAAAKAALPRARRFHQFAGQRRDLARLVVDVAVAAEIAGIVVDDSFRG
jgi:hypothetical protein